MHNTEIVLAIDQKNSVSDVQSICFLTKLLNESSILERERTLERAVF